MLEGAHHLVVAGAAASGGAYADRRQAAQHLDGHISFLQHQAAQPLKPHLQQPALALVYLYDSYVLQWKHVIAKSSTIAHLPLAQVYAAH